MQGSAKFSVPPRTNIKSLAPAAISGRKPISSYLHGAQFRATSLSPRRPHFSRIMDLIMTVKSFASAIARCRFAGHPSGDSRQRHARLFSSRLPRGPAPTRSICRLKVGDVQAETGSAGQRDYGVAGERRGTDAGTGEHPEPVRARNGGLGVSSHTTTATNTVLFPMCRWNNSRRQPGQ